MGKICGSDGEDLNVSETMLRTAAEQLTWGPAREWWVGAGVSPSPYGSANQTILGALHEEGCSSRDPPSIEAYLRI